MIDCLDDLEVPKEAEMKYLLQRLNNFLEDVVNTAYNNKSIRSSSEFQGLGKK